jgi:hypothetical protein
MWMIKPSDKPELLLNAAQYTAIVSPLSRNKYFSVVVQLKLRTMPVEIHRRGMQTRGAES